MIGDIGVSLKLATRKEIRGRYFPVLGSRVTIRDFARLTNFS
jgi:hypothetical protein